MNNLSIPQSLTLMNAMATLSLKADAQRYFFGYLWWILEPLLWVGVFYLVFEVLLGTGRADFLVFLATPVARTPIAVHGWHSLVQPRWTRGVGIGGAQSQVEVCCGMPAMARGSAPERRPKNCRATPHLGAASGRRYPIFVSLSFSPLAL